MSVTLSITIAGPDAAKIKELMREKALKQGMSLSEFVVDCIAERLEKLGAKKSDA